MLIVSVCAIVDAAGVNAIGPEMLDRWSAPYRGWHYWPDHVIPAKPKIPGHEVFGNTDCPTVFQLPGSRTWYMSFIAFDGKGYNSFVAESDDLVHRTKMRLAMGFGPKGEFDHGGCVLGAYLYESYGIKAPRVLKKRDGRLWSLYGAYPRQGGYDEKFCSDPKVFRDGGHWTMIYFGVGRGGAHVMVAFSRDLVHWTAHPEPLYKAGGNPSGLDKQYAHKISLVWNPANETFYMHYCACGPKGRGIGLITSKPLPQPRR